MLLSETNRSRQLYPRFRDLLIEEYRAMAKSTRQIEFVTTNKLQTTNSCSLLSKLQFRGLRISLRNNKIPVVLEERRAVLDDHRHLTNGTGKHGVKTATHLHCIRFTAIMNTLNILYAHSRNKGIHGIDLLANRIKENTRTSSIKSKGNAGESSTSTHIKEMLRLNRKIAIQSKRINNVQNQGAVNILDASEIHNLVNLVHIKEVLHTTLSSLSIKFDVELRGKVDNLSDKSSDLIDGLVKGMQRNGSGRFISHMYQSNQ